MRLKRFKVKATVTARHTIFVYAYDAQSAMEAAKCTYAAGNLEKVGGNMEITSCEHWPVEGLPK